MSGNRTLSTTLPRISCRCWVALANIMRLSLKKGAHAALSSAAWQEIRVRSGRDDKSVAGRDSTFPGKVRGTADPSAALGMTKGRANVPWKVAAGPMRYLSRLVGCNE